MKKIGEIIILLLFCQIGAYSQSTITPHDMLSKIMGIVQTDSPFDISKEQLKQKIKENGYSYKEIKEGKFSRWGQINIVKTDLYYMGLAVGGGTFWTKDGRLKEHYVAFNGKETENAESLHIMFVAELRELGLELYEIADSKSNSCLKYLMQDIVNRGYAGSKYACRNFYRAEDEQYIYEVFLCNKMVGFTTYLK